MVITYCEKSHTLYCSVCLAFSKCDNPFTTGMEDWRHIGQRIKEHESLGAHRDAAYAYLSRANRSNIPELLDGNQMSLAREQVRQRRQILERVIDIVKVIGKRGLSYRGDKLEAAYSLEDEAADHGTFLELVLLLSKYDVILQAHVSSCIEKSKRLHDSGAKGRGSLVTLLSKTTVNAVIEAIGRLIKESIAAEVKEAGMFSIQIDTTQDITAKDQFSDNSLCD